MPMRVGLPSLGSTSITLETWIGPSFSITPPTVLGALGVADLLRALVALDDVQALDVDLLLLGVDAQHAAGLAAVLAADHDHGVVLADPDAAMAQSTSGASETIFMKLRSRSSRATGPKMRVPRGLFWASISTAAFSSKAM